MFGVLANADGVHRHSKPAHTHALGFAQKSNAKGVCQFQPRVTNPWDNESTHR
jgi:hypothetical protein